MPAESLVQVLKTISAAPAHPWADETPGPLDDAALVVPDRSVSSGLVMTIDVVTPMVDDPRTFGAIAAANAISDVYAMGGTPQVALSFIGFPSSELPLEMLGDIMKGLQDTCARASCAIVGGHTIIDPEPKAGLAVTGTVDRSRVWSHRAAQPGQAIVLTKRLGTGVVVQAMKKQVAPEPAAAGAIASMMRLNLRARDAGLACGATSATDVTGFGLLGHLGNVCAASGVAATLRSDAIPMLEGVLELAAQGCVPGGSRKNLKRAEATTLFDDDVPELTRLLLADAQTSGGLLLFLPVEAAPRLVDRLLAEGEEAYVIGKVDSGEQPARADASNQVLIRVTR